MIKSGFASLLILMLFAGCFSTQTINIEKLDNGTKEYKLSSNYLDLKDPTYRGYDIGSYSIELSSKNNIVEVSLIHRFTFTVGSGIPNETYCPLCPSSSRNSPEDFSEDRWMKEAFWKGLKKFDIGSTSSSSKHLEVKNYGNTKYSAMAIFDSFNEKITNSYDKKDFIEYINNNNIMIDINARKFNGVVNIKKIHNIKKFVNCLENENMCKDEE